MATTLSDDQIACYRDHGYVAPITVMPSAAAEDCARALADYEQARGYQFTREERRKPHLLFSWLDKI